MVEPARALRMTVTLAMAALVSGCAFVPKERLDDCHKQCQSLQLETSQLKDVVLTLRSTNQDLTHRSVEDAQHLKTLDEQNQQLERSVLAYQDQRDQLVSAFEQFRNQLAASSDKFPSAMLDRFHDFSRTHPGCTIDAECSVATLPAETLFQPGSSEWTPEAKPLLRDYATLLSTPDVQNMTVRIVADPADSSVRLTSLVRPAPAEPLDTLALARAKRLRDALVEQAMLDPSRVQVAGERAADQTQGTPSAASPLGRTLEIHLHPGVLPALNESAPQPETGAPAQAAAAPEAAVSDPRAASGEITPPEPPGSAEVEPKP
jgi:outer membrane protein OmpA-like peptidoglycan-associated protein